MTSLLVLTLLFAAAAMVGGIPVADGIVDRNKIVIHCEENEMWFECGRCDGTCNNLNPVCPMMCRPSCGCIDGHVRHGKDRRCIPAHQCPMKLAPVEIRPPLPDRVDPAVCGDKEVWFPCGACDGSCSEIEPICSKICLPGSCGCMKDHVRESKGPSCIHKSECMKEPLLVDLPLADLRHPPAEIQNTIVRPPPQDIRRPPEDIRQPPADIHEGLAEIQNSIVRPPPQDIRRPPEDVRRPPEDIRPPPAHIHGGPAEIQNSIVRPPPQDIRRPPEDIRQPPADIHGGLAEIQNIIVRPPPQDIRRPPEDVRRPPEDIRQPPADIHGGLAEIQNSIVRPPPQDIRQPPADIRQPPADIRDPSGDINLPPADVRIPFPEWRPNRCPAKEMWFPCGACDGSCLEFEPVCTKMCQPGSCGCLKDHVREPKGHSCIHKHDCPMLMPLFPGNN